jgi:hypothetical protein
MRYISDNSSWISTFNGYRSERLSIAKFLLGRRGIVGVEGLNARFLKKKQPDV